MTEENEIVAEVLNGELVLRVEGNGDAYLRSDTTVAREP